MTGKTIFIFPGFQGFPAAVGTLLSPCSHFPNINLTCICFSLHFSIPSDEATYILISSMINAKGKILMPNKNYHKRLACMLSIIVFKI